MTFVDDPFSPLIVFSASVKNGYSAEEREVLSRCIQDWASKQGAQITDQVAFMNVLTCHRAEVYAWGFDFTSQLRELFQKAGAQIRPSSVYVGRQALIHWARTASSLNSEVLGETQVTGQLKDSLDLARSRGWVHGGPFDRLSQWVQRVTKKIRSQTGLGTGTVSVAHVAVDGLLDVFESLEDKRALVVGAGSMALQAIERLRSKKISEIIWVNRSDEKILKHPLSLEMKTSRFEDHARLAWECQISVYATASPSPILTLDQLALNRKESKSLVREPRVIIDLGLPRNVDALVHGQQGFLLRNVDEFRDRAGQNSLKRRQSKEAAEEILSLDLAQFEETFRARVLGPHKTELMAALDAISFKDLVEHSKVENFEQIEYMLRSLFAKVYHRIIEEVDQLDPIEAERLLTLLTKAWRQPGGRKENNQLEKGGPSQGSHIVKIKSGS